MNERFDTVEEFQKEMSEHLSNPRSGQKQLTALFKEKDTTEDEAVQQSQKSRILEGLTNNVGQTILGRAFAAVSVLPLVLVAVLNIEFLGATTPNIFGIIAIVVLVGAAAVWPALGVSASCVAISVALLIHGNHIVAGVLTLISIL